MSTRQPVRIHVFGGTSDALLLCRALSAKGLAYSLSVATEVGRETALGLEGEIHVGRLDKQQMQDFFASHQIQQVIDATHPFASVVSCNIVQAAQECGIRLIRYERPSQIDQIEHPLLTKVEDIESACQVAARLGTRFFLTTGSKDLGHYRRLLPEKTLIARVLPTASVIQSCVDLGFGIGEIVAIKGPFTHDMNAAMYRFYQPDAVITKESGAEGGFHEKVEPCLEAGIACIVIQRPKQHYCDRVASPQALIAMLRQQLDEC